jgi:hypothetical protein
VAESSDYQPKRRRGPGRPFQPGQSGNPGGRRRKIQDIEEMLDEEHRTVANLREIFAMVRRVAMGVERGVYHRGVRVATEIEYDATWMTLYLNRVIGPVREIASDDEIEEMLKGAPDPVLSWWQAIRQQTPS